AAVAAVIGGGACHIGDAGAQHGGARREVPGPVGRGDADLQALVGLQRPFLPTLFLWAGAAGEVRPADAAEPAAPQPGSVAGQGFVFDLPLDADDGVAVRFRAAWHRPQRDVRRARVDHDLLIGPQLVDRRRDRAAAGENGHDRKLVDTVAVDAHVEVAD